MKSHYSDLFRDTNLEDNGSWLDYSTFSDAEKKAKREKYIPIIKARNRFAELGFRTGMKRASRVPNYIIRILEDELDEGEVNYGWNLGDNVDIFEDKRWYYVISPGEYNTLHEPNRGWYRVPSLHDPLHYTFMTAFLKGKRKGEKYNSKDHRDIRVHPFLKFYPELTFYLRLTLPKVKLLHEAYMLKQTLKYLIF